MRTFGPLAVAAGVAGELIVLGDYQGQLRWLVPVLIAVGVSAALAMLALSDRRVRLAAVGTSVAVLLVAPTVWAFDTLGHATSGTFPEGGPGSLATGPGGFGGRPGARFARGGGQVQLFGPGGSTGAGAGTENGPPSFAGAAGGPAGAPPGAGFSGPRAGTGGTGGFPGAGAIGRGGPGGGPGGFAGNEPSAGMLEYVKAHGGGTIAVASQSGAATAIIQSGADVAGIGGFSGRESDVSISWLAQEVSSGKIRWVLGESSSGLIPADGRAGSKAAMAAVSTACKRVTLPSSTASESTRGSAMGASGSLYDCQGRAAELQRAGA